MDILLIGGTGAIGGSLINILEKNCDNTIFVTSRKAHKSCDKLKYIQVDGKAADLVKMLPQKYFDVVFDFMIYDTEEFEEKIDALLEITSQYFFFSSARCYADSEKPINESSARLIDVCDDIEYLSTDEYGLSKGKEENVLMKKNKKNWTIIRPYITYNTYRLQLGVYEKENWLYRSLQGRTVVFPKDIADKKTSLTYAPDVAGALVDLIGKQDALGRAFHITTDEVYTWKDVLELYCAIVQKKTGKKIKIKWLADSTSLCEVWNPWQIKYDRLFNRSFDNAGIETVRGKYTFKSTAIGLEECIDAFLQTPKWNILNGAFEGWCDRQTGEITPILEIKGIRNKLSYLRRRFL